jgi:segregation and condensation protein B
MSEAGAIPELKEIIGAIVFAAKDPLTVAQILAVLRRTAERHGGVTRDFAAATESDVQAAITALSAEYLQRKVGVQVIEVAQGVRLENIALCGAWVREFLDKGRPQRLSQPALETLAIIAYRQPVVRAEIEAVRGVAVDQILRNLLDLQLIRIAGRSEQLGRPWMFGTTQKFLEHFGLRSVSDLPGVDELKRIDAERFPGAARNAGAPELELKIPSPDPDADRASALKSAFTAGEGRDARSSAMALPEAETAAETDADSREPEADDTLLRALRSGTDDSEPGSGDVPEDDGTDASGSAESRDPDES